MKVMRAGSEWELSSETLVSWTQLSKTHESSTHGDMMAVNNHFKIAHSNSTFIFRRKVKPIFTLDMSE